MHNLHEQDSGFRFLVAILNFSVLCSSFGCVGIISHVLEPRYQTLSETWLTFRTFAVWKYVYFLRLYWFWCLSVNISFMIVGEMPWHVLYISVARAPRFLPWLLTISSNSSKEDFLSLYINEDIFHEADLFCYFLCDYDTSKLTDKSSREQRHIWMSERILCCVISVKTLHAWSKLYLNKRAVKS